MSVSAIISQILDILFGALTTTATEMGSALSGMVSGIFLTGTGETTALSVFGVIVLIFAGVSLALGLFRWCLNFITSLGARNR